MSDVNAGNIQFWKVVEATAKLAACSIKAADFTGNDAVALHNEGIAALISQLKQAGSDASACSCSRNSKAPIERGDRLTSLSALQVAGELLPLVAKAIHQKGYRDDYTCNVALVISLMATSLGDRNERQLSD